MYLELFDGYSYEEMNPKDPKKRLELPFTRSSFKEEKIRFDMASFQLERSDKERYSNVAQFMNIKQLQQSEDSLSKAMDLKREEFKDKLYSYYSFQDSLPSLSVASIAPFNINDLNSRKRKRLKKSASSLVRTSKSYIYNTKRNLKYKKKKLTKAKIEWHRKFTLSFACVVLFLIGAPLGAIIRKGGMGMPVLISILFFLIYHISSITGEKSAYQYVLSVPEGMWVSSLILTPLGLFFTYKAAKDSTLFEISIHRGIISRWQKLWKQKKS